jgi:hypothetical protein
MSGGSDRWIRWTTTACVGLLALIAGTVSYLHMHTLVQLHGQPGWVAALTPFSVDGMIVAASTTLLADSRPGGHGGFLPWALLVVGSVASLAANVAVAEPTATGRDRGVAVIRAHRRLRTADAPGPAKRRRRRHFAPDKTWTVDRPGRGISIKPGSMCLSGTHRLLGRGRGPASEPVRAGISSGRRGSGRCPTRPVTARCRAAASPPRYQPSAKTTPTPPGNGHQPSRSDSHISIFRISPKICTLLT